eukprot:1155342-Pelagomonas_calceolata.AAC.5
MAIVNAGSGQRQSTAWQWSTLAVVSAGAQHGNGPRWQWSAVEHGMAMAINCTVCAFAHQKLSQDGASTTLKQNEHKQCLLLYSGQQLHCACLCTQEAESEWSQHHAKAVIDTNAKKGLHASIPPNFPYTYVQFGYGTGYVHVIDDESQFDAQFARQSLPQASSPVAATCHPMWYL